MYKTQIKYYINLLLFYNKFKFKAVGIKSLLLLKRGPGPPHILVHNAPLISQSHPVLDLHHREPLPLVRRLAPHRRDPAVVHQVRDAAAAPAPRLPRRRGPQGLPRRPRRRAALGRRPAAAPHHPEGARDRGRRRERTGESVEE
jgi:hypothetical protein